MKVVILAGGYGTRLSEETTIKPKPLVEVGSYPILWHIMNYYASFGFHEFIICLGYKGYMIKEFFNNYYLYNSDVTIDLATNEKQYHHSKSSPWKVTMVDTGADTMTGGRLKRISEHIDGDFLMTYGDGVGDIDIHASIEQFKSSKRLATVTAVNPLGRFGSLSIEGDVVSQFQEKPLSHDHFINAGFFVLSPKVFDYIEGDSTIWEQEPLKQLAAEGQLSAYKHRGFWHPMDTLRDKQYLNSLWSNNEAPWARP